MIQQTVVTANSAPKKPARTASPAGMPSTNSAITTAATRPPMAA